MSEFRKILLLVEHEVVPTQKVGSGPIVEVRVQQLIPIIRLYAGIIEGQHILVLVK